MDSVYKTIIEQQKPPITLDTQNKLEAIKTNLKRELENEIVSKLISLSEIYRQDLKETKRIATKDNYASDLLPFYEKMYEESQDYLQKLFRNIEFTERKL